LESEEKKNKTICQSRVKKKLESEKKKKKEKQNTICQNQELGRKCRRLNFSRQELKEN
jgi:hypothetical protein